MSGVSTQHILIKYRDIPVQPWTVKIEGELRWEERFGFTSDIVTIRFNLSSDLYLNLHCPEVVTALLQGNFHKDMTQEMFSLLSAQSTRD